jgi:ribonuclease HI
MRWISPYLRIAGTTLLKPPQMALVQTDGSFYHRVPLSRTAVILQAEDEWSLLKSYTEGEHKNSTESEWASILDGLVFSKSKDQGAVELENDNLGVINSLKTMKSKKDMDRYYLHAIMKEAKAMEWVAVRWIPREQNMADRLFRA